MKVQNSAVTSSKPPTSTSTKPAVTPTSVPAGGNLQKYTGALGGIAAPPVTGESELAHNTYSQQLLIPTVIVRPNSLR
jgi:hypothetical protein